MSGLCDAHTHFSWNNSADLDGLGTMPVEEHLLFSIESARTYIDSGYTMCLGAASAKDRLDVVCRDAINAGRIPGPRYLANGPEIADAHDTATLEVLPRIGHLTTLEAAGPVTDLLLKFL